MICVSSPLPQGQPSLCGAAVLQWSAESHFSETFYISCRYIKIVRRRGGGGEWGATDISVFWYTYAVGIQDIHGEQHTTV